MQKTMMRILFALAAVLAAKLLADLAHDDLGLSQEVIREDALLMAAGFSGFLVLVLYSDRFGKK